MQWAKVAAAKKKLVASLGTEMRFEEPEETWMMESDYIQLHGDPEHNGRGHRRIRDEDGSVKVAMPGPRIWKVKRARVNLARVDTTHANNQDETHGIGEGNLESRFSQFRSVIFGSQAVGHQMSLSDILGGRIMAAPRLRQRAAHFPPHRRPIVRAPFASSVSHP